MCWTLATRGHLAMTNPRGSSWTSSQARRSILHYRIRALGLNQAVAVAADLAGTVAQVHRAGILHRDLKPSNLMVRRLGAEADIVLLDCGLSFHEDETTKDITGQDPIRNKFLSLSEGNTPGGNRRDPRSDLTAVAGILFYCLTRKNIGLLFDERGRASSSTRLLRARVAWRCR